MEPVGKGGQGVEVTLVIPAYREEENLRLLLPRVLEVLRATGRSHEVLVVDTVAPTDATAEVCAAAGARCVARSPTNVYGDAVRTGIREARGEWIAFMDADGSHAPDVLARLLAEAPPADVVVGSRYVEGGYTENPWILQLMSRVVNLCYTLVLGLPIQDVSNSFKVYRGAWLRELSLRCDNFDVIEEMVFKLHRRHRAARFREVPMAFRKRMFGATKRNLVAFMVSYLVTLLRLRFMGDD